MRPSRIIGSSTFRLAIVYLVLFSASVVGVLGFVYWNTVQVIVDQTDATIEAEVRGLAEQYRQRGLPGLVRILRERSQGSAGERGIYLLTGADLTVIAGNLNRWPPAAEPTADGWVDFVVELQPATPDRPQRARARVFLLPDGFRLLVGRDTTERSAFADLITDAMVGGLALTLVLGVIGGLLISRNLLGRIEAINRGAQAILQGDMMRRMPVSGNGDEFDRLGTNLNSMLDRIDGLMAGIRGVADDVAHDLRTPISRLRSRLEVALMGHPSEEGLREAIEATIREADGILNTFNALLSIGLAESGVLRDRFEPVDLSETVTDAVELYIPLAEEKGISLSVATVPGLVRPGNRHLLVQAVANLIDNAVKYTPPGGSVRVSTYEESGGAVVEVADTGPGIPASERGRVLERFTRLDASRSKPGSGLGLSLAAAVARLHEARILLDDHHTDKEEPGLKARLVFKR